MMEIVVYHDKSVVRDQFDMIMDEPLTEDDEKLEQIDSDGNEQDDDFDIIFSNHKNCNLCI